VNGAGLERRRHTGLLSVWFGMSMGILVARKIRTGRFVDNPSDRLALVDLATLPVDGDDPPAC